MPWAMASAFVDATPDNATHGRWCEPEPCLNGIYCFPAPQNHKGGSGERPQTAHVAGFCQLIQRFTAQELQGVPDTPEPLEVAVNVRQTLHDADALLLCQAVDLLCASVGSSGADTVDAGATPAPGATPAGGLSTIHVKCFGDYGCALVAACCLSAVACGGREPHSYLDGQPLQLVLVSSCSPASGYSG